MPKTDSGLVGILIQETNSEGLITSGQYAGIGSSIPTTASKFAVGALITSTVDAKTYFNAGTTASPSWNAVSDATVGEIALTTGSVLIGAAGVGSALDAKGDGKILVGNGTTATSVSVSGDATLANTGALTIAANAVTLAKFGRSDASGKIVIGQGAGADAQYAALSGGATMDGSGAVTITSLAGAPKRTQATPTAKTVSATLTANEILAGIITVAQGSGGTSALQLPTVADLEAALTGEANNDAFDLSVINISTVDAEDASITTNTGWTLVGSMDFHAYSAAGSLNSSGILRLRKTGSGTWTAYRIS